MKNISFYSQSRRYKYQSEIIETEISDWNSRHYLPRHISVPQTQSHRERDLRTIDHVPRVCRIDSNNQNGTNLAVDILKYQLSDRASQEKHLENVCSNLQRRLLVAESQGNNQLIDILQDEYNQLALKCSLMID